jgi:hypothetical protein
LTNGPLGYPLEPGYEAATMKAAPEERRWVVRACAWQIPPRTLRASIVCTRSATTCISLSRALMPPCAAPRSGQPSALAQYRPGRRRMAWRRAAGQIFRDVTTQWNGGNMCVPGNQAECEVQ